METPTNKTNTIWKVCCAIVIITGALTLSPIVIPTNAFEPKLMGMPYTLWMGILISLFLWVVTYIAILNHPGKND